MSTAPHKSLKTLQVCRSESRWLVVRKAPSVDA